ncbi:MAG: hypothetical protein H6Q55_666 [Deltaproteobacteria bacterium]|jgi:hypothetical protein|nr:hypothetical protein [Deltaproteobacteria bacterium]
MALERLQTAASVISCVSRIERESAALYERLATLHQELGSVFSAFAKENLKYESNIRRAYYNVVSDALETGFCFDLTVDTMLTAPALLQDASTQDASTSDILRVCIRLEEDIRGFYVNAAAQSKSLLADVPRAMERVAKARSEREKELKRLLDAAKVSP